jgi:hypothetical protein
LPRNPVGWQVGQIKTERAFVEMGHQIAGEAEGSLDPALEYLVHGHLLRLIQSQTIANRRAIVVIPAKAQWH